MPMIRHCTRLVSARLLGLVCVSALVSLSALHAIAAEPFTPEQVVAEAKRLSAQPFVPPPAYPEALGQMSFEAWKDIRFKKKQTIWNREKLPFRIQLFHPGMVYDTPARIHVVSRGKSDRLPFAVQDFDYGGNHNISGQMSGDMGHAGFRILTTLTSGRRVEEVASFLGATFFRAVGKGQRYGLSARGLAVDTGLQDGEEFPYFKKFWIEKPGKKSRHLTIHALLDSKSLTGAYTFVLRPGRSTTMDVTARLFLRSSVSKPGLAPLTSMFLFGENTSPRPLEDFRPEVHDSDGLLLARPNGEWIWRPLDNPAKLRIDVFEANAPKGFGLFQRDSDFHHYEDLEAHFERRPNLWVEPKGDWGKGHVELIRIPSKKEIHDNIVVFWTPAEPLPVGQPLVYEYRLRWNGAANPHAPLSYVEATRTMRLDKTKERFVVDFQGKALRLLNPPAKVESVVTCGPGARITDTKVAKNPATGGWRLTFTVQSESDTGPMDFVLPRQIAPVGLRAFLRINDKTLTETWNYAFIP